MRYLTYFTLLILLPSIAMAQPYVIDQEHSYIQFAGEHAGDAFTGKFKTWSAEIDFDESTLTESSLNVTIDTTSAETGNKMYDGTLPQKDWFAVKEHPTAQFISTAITQKDDHFTAEGMLTLRGIEKPVSFDFALKPAPDDERIVHSHAELMLNRLDFDIGKQSDRDAEWVSKDIALTLHITASKAD